ncbi:hypothetical protein [Sphingorhabdus sp. EL138]|uniref:hypothetical protein n=1 Tax=Sphingorhabdus sp. EL138 TaxID=2073156 RepID=UPI000D685F64|nr:hypothetical protein [Sphingorhabdus sp. EL138]
MTGPIFFIALIVIIVALPAFAGWKFKQKSDQFVRMASTIVAGQLILTPGISWLAYSEDRNFGDDPLKAIIIYAAMALMISIMTFAIMEIRKTSQKK